MSENYHEVSVRSETTMTDDLKARLDALHVWPQAVADAYAAELTPRQIDKLYAVGKVATEAADRISTLEAEIKMLTRAGIIEVAIRNPSVADYMHHWESRAEKAEAALADMTRQRDAAIKSLADVREETIRLNTATDAQYAKTVAKLREERDAAMAAAEAQAEARGMRKAAEHFADNALGRTITSIHRGILALADETEAAAKGGV